MGFININSLTEPKTNVTSNNYYQHLMDLCYNLWSIIISILSCTGIVCLFSSLDWNNITCNSVGLPASEIIHSYLSLLLFPCCLKKKSILLDTFIYCIAMHNSLSKSFRLPVSAYIQTIIRPIHYLQLTERTIQYSYVYWTMHHCVYWTMHHCDSWNKRPTWYHLLFYFTSYVLNMFRTLIYPSSGACDYSVELPHWSYCSWFYVCWSFGVVGV